MGDSRSLNADGDLAKCVFSRNSEILLPKTGQSGFNEVRTRSATPPPTDPRSEPLFVCAGGGGAREARLGSHLAAQHRLRV